MNDDDRRETLANLPESTWEAISHRLGVTGRQLDVVKGLVSDDTEAQIATLLGIKAGTVHDYRKRLYRHLDVHSQIELLRVIVDAYLEIRREEGEKPPEA